MKFVTIVQGVGVIIGGDDGVVVGVVGCVCFVDSDGVVIGAADFAGFAYCWCIWYC